MMTTGNIGGASSSVERIRSLLVVLATTGTIAFNWMSAIGYVNGTTPAMISAKYPTLVTPAGYAFAIWSLIYLGLITFSIYQVLPSQIDRFRPVRSIYIVSCVLNCVWIYFWHAEAIVVCFVVICLLWITLMMIESKLARSRSLGETWFARAPFGIYFGWVDAALTVNFAVMLVYLDKMPTGTTGRIIGASLLGLTAVTAVIIRILFRDFFFPLAVAWAATAIAVKNSGETMIVVAAAVVVVICLVTTGSIVSTLKDSTSE